MAYGGLLTIKLASPIRHSKSILSPIAGTNRRHSKERIGKLSEGKTSQKNRTTLIVGSSEDHVNVG